MKYSFVESSELSTLKGGRFKVKDKSDAFNFCISLAFSHYENFPVASILLPKRKRKYIAAIYAFARIADDIADENLEIPADRRIEVLNKYSEKYKSMSETSNPIFIAVRRTIKDLDIPHLPFDKLLKAFKRDILFTQADRMEDLYDYCSYSANPVGELVLRVFNNYDSKTAPLSEAICTALQLTNFWQDLSRDINKNRLFIPKEKLTKYKLKLDGTFTSSDLKNLDKCLNELFDETEKLYNSGKEIIKHLRNIRLKLEIKATILGGKKILKLCRNSRSELLTKRPKLKKSDLFIIFVRSIFCKI